MNVWEVVFQLLWDYMDDWDDERTVEEVVVASDYANALKEATMIAEAETFFDDDNGIDHFVKEVRLLSITRGQSIDGIAKEIAVK